MLNRYKLDQLTGEYQGVARYRGRDTGPKGDRSVPVVILREAGEPLPPMAPARPPGEGDIATIPLHTLPSRQVYPSLAWERSLLEHSTHLALPRIMHSFHEGGYNYLIEEAPEGKPLREAWAEPDLTYAHRFGWLAQAVEAMQILHSFGVLVAGVSPDSVVITPSGQVMIGHIDQWVPLNHARGRLAGACTLYHAPELRSPEGAVDFRADQFGIGVTLLSLCLGRELTDDDFLGPGVPRSFYEFFPDSPPLLGRLITKLTQVHPEARFPTHDRRAEDPTGFAELRETLERCARTLDRVTIDVAAWTTTGMTRTGNEDCFAVVHSRESTLEEVDDFALLILADGMGGMEGGEIASALTVQTIREMLTAEPPFSTTARKPANTPPTPTPRTSAPAGTEMQLPALRSAPEGTEMQMPALKMTPAYEPTLTLADTSRNTPALAPGGADEDRRNPGVKWLEQRRLHRDSEAREDSSHQRRLMQAIREANQKVFNASRSGFGQPGMGATLEAVLIDVNQAVIGHVGDSRVYHMRDGKLTLITHDQTYVFREVAEGRMSPEQAEVHPRRSELQQAVGGRVDIFPNFYTVELRPGDWLVLCTDGLSNAVKAPQIEAIVARCTSASMASRRLVNRANQLLANDNVTVVVARIV